MAALARPFPVLRPRVASSGVAAFLLGLLTTSAQCAFGQDSVVATPIADAAMSLASHVAPAASNPGSLVSAVTPELFSGSLAYAIPIVLPSGKNGLTPTLALSYNSDAAGDHVGVGWTLGGDRIERDRRAGFDETKPRFLYSTPDGSVELRQSDDVEYRATVEGSFARLRLLKLADGSSYWEMTETSGRQYLYGRSAETRLSDPANPTRVYAWLLEQVEDLDGNRIVFKYGRERGELYLEEVSYAFDLSGSPIYKVVFTWVPRPDTGSLLTPGFAVERVRRLTDIGVWAKNALIRRYALAYGTPSIPQQQSRASGRSLLRSVQMFGRDGTSSLSPILLEYDETPPGWVRSTYSGPSEIEGEDCLVGEVDGDGRADLLCYSRLAKFWLKISASGTAIQANQWSTLPALAADNKPGAFPDPLDKEEDMGAQSLCVPGDFNGDGLLDVACILASPHKWVVGLSQKGAAGWTIEDWTDSTVELPEDTKPTFKPGKSCRGGDFNGDGKTDLACSFASLDQRILLAGSPGWTVEKPPLPAGAGDGGCIVGDFDSDRRDELLCLERDQWKHARRAGDSAWSSTDLQPPPEILPAGCIAGDHNGDGEIDLLCEHNGKWTLVGWTGQEFTTVAWRAGSPVPDGMVVAGACLPIDLGGDNLDDVVCFDENAAKWRAGVSNGGGLTVSSMGGVLRPVVRDGFQRFAVSHSCFASDFNGDGQGDVICLESTGAFAAGLSTTAAIDRLMRVTNSIGGTTELRYIDSSTVPKNNLPYNKKLLSQATIHDGRRSDQRTDYSYSGGFFQRSTREFRGFAEVKTVDAGDGPETTLATVVRYFQGAGPTIETDRPDAPIAYMRGKESSVTTLDGNGHLIGRVDYSYAQDDVPPYFNPATSILASRFGAGDALAFTTRTDYTFDAFGNVTSENDLGDTNSPDDDRVIRRSFTAEPARYIVSRPLTEEVLDNRGNRLAMTEFYYDGASTCSQVSNNRLPSRGHATRVRHWLSGDRWIELGSAYDSSGNAICTRDARGSISKTTYDDSGLFAIAYEDVLGHQQRQTYFGVQGTPVGSEIFGALTSTVDPNGQAVLFDYDALGRIVRLTQPDGSWEAWSYEHFGASSVQHIRHDTSAGLSDWSYFDGLGRQWQATATAPGGRTTSRQTEFDKAGRVARRSLPFFTGDAASLWTSYSYDAEGRLIREQRWDGTKIETCWEPRVSTLVDAGGHLRRHFVDVRGNLVRVEEFDTTFAGCREALSALPKPYGVTFYSYDPQGNLVQIKDAKGNITSLTYDGMGQKLSLDDPDSGLIRYSYDPDGSLSSIDDARHRKVFLTYDALGRLVQRDFDNRKSIGQGDERFTYDSTAPNGIGRVSAIRHRRGIDRFTYDVRGAVAAEQRTIDGVTRRKSLVRDGLGRLTKVSYEEIGTIEYRYDGPAIDSVLLDGAVIARFSDHSSLLQPSRLDLRNGIVERYDYSKQGAPGACDQGSLRPCRVIWSTSSGTALLSEELAYDAVGNVIAISRSDLGKRSISYDGIGRLVQVVLTSQHGQISTELAVQYDAIGNVTSTSTLGTYAYASTHPHAVTKAGRRTLGYDASGNVIRLGSMTLSYDAESRLAEVRDGNGTQTRYFYDSDGDRIEQIAVVVGKDSHGNQVVGGQHLRYYGEDLVCVDDVRCTLFVIAHGRRLAAKAGGKLFFLHADPSGSQLAISDPKGQFSVDYSGIGFGSPEGVLAAVFAGDTHRFGGQEWDSATTLYFTGSRYYDPELGRFLVPDSAIASMLDPQLLNRYSYANNNPYTLSDPDGQFAIAAVIVGAIVGAIVAGSSSDWDPQAVFLGAVIGAVSGGVGSYVGGVVAGSSSAAGTGIVASMAGGAASGGTSAILYRAAGYDVDVVQAMGTGAFTGGLGSAAAQVIGFPGGGGAVAGGVSAAISGDDIGQGALQGFATEAATSIAEGATDDSPGFATKQGVGEVADPGNASEGDVYAFRSRGSTMVDVGNLAWSYGLGDGYSHVLIALSNNEFAEITPGYKGQVYSRSEIEGRYAGRRFVKGHVDLDSGARSRVDVIARNTPSYLKPYVCSTYVNAVSGRYLGLTPGLVARGPLLRGSYGFYRRIRH